MKIYFFAENVDYDGEVRAALSDNYLFLVIPSTYTILVYRIANDRFELVNFRNYRPELYLRIPSRRARGLPDFGTFPSLTR